MNITGLRWDMISRPGHPERTVPAMHRMCHLKPEARWSNLSLTDMNCQAIGDHYHEDAFGLLEDDACPVRKDWYRELEKISGELEEYGRPWDVLYLGGILLGVYVNRVTPSLVIPLEGVYCTQALVYRKSAYDKVLRWGKMSADVRADFNGGHAIDWWLHAQPDLRRLVANPMVITQLNSELDFENAVSRHGTMSGSYQDMRDKPDCFEEVHHYPLHVPEDRAGPHYAELCRLVSGG